MKEIKDRLKTIRINANMSQDEFGKMIGISRSQISCYEKGLREVTERSLNDICREFNVSKDWLLTGEGEMYIISEQDENLADALAEISLSDNEKLKEIVQKLTKLDDRTIDTINELIDLLLEKEKKI